MKAKLKVGSQKLETSIINTKVNCKMSQEHWWEMGLKLKKKSLKLLLKKIVVKSAKQKT